MDTGYSFGTRGFSAESLQAVFELNRRFLDDLMSTARRPSRELKLQLALELKEALLELTEDDVTRLAQSAVCLLDAGFADEGRWKALSENRPPRTDGLDIELGFSHLIALQLSQVLFVQAWTMTCLSPECARVVFGMSRACSQYFARLQVNAVQRLADQNAGWVRPRWADRPQIWRRLISSAQQSENSRVPPVGTRVLLQVLADLELATTANA